MGKVSKAERRLLEQLAVKPGDRVWMKEFDPTWVPDQAEDLEKDELKERARAFLNENIAKLAESQELLYAERRLLGAGRAPGDGRRGQGRHDQARDVAA